MIYRHLGKTGLKVSSRKPRFYSCVNAMLMFTSCFWIEALQVLPEELLAKSVVFLAGVSSELRRMGDVREPDRCSRYDLRSRMQT